MTKIKNFYRMEKDFVYFYLSFQIWIFNDTEAG